MPSIQQIPLKERKEIQKQIYFPYDPRESLGTFSLTIAQFVVVVVIVVDFNITTNTPIHTILLHYRSSRNRSRKSFLFPLEATKSDRVFLVSVVCIVCSGNISSGC